jgi:hypothetical protein
MELEHSPQWEELSVNHLEGRTAAFFCYGDGGADELDPEGRPYKLRHKQWFDPEHEPFENDRDAYAPLVWQSRYSGIEVPDHLWQYCEFGNGRKYSDNQSEDMVRETHVMEQFDRWTDTFAGYVADKGKVSPGRWRAFDYKAPGHFVHDAKLLLRDYRMRVGLAPADSSPAEQDRLGINRDRTLSPEKGEGEKLRDK